MPRPRVLRPSTPVLRRAPGEVQLGTDPRWAVRLVGLAEEDEQLVLALGAAAGAARHLPDLPTERGARLERLLGDANVLVPRPVRRVRSPAPGAGAADLAVLGALRPDGAGHRTLATRARSTVAVVGLGRIGATVAVTLASAGVGAVTLHDPAPVLVTDVGAGPYRLRDVGTPRERALARTVAEVSPDVRTAAGTGTSAGAGPGSADATGTVTGSGTGTGGSGVEPPDVVVVVEHGCADPQRVRELVGDGVAHLSVVVREADVVVGPFVRPGTDPCLTCADLARAEVDPCWPQVARQLREQAGAGSEESVLAAVAGAVAAGQVLAALDGSTPRTCGAFLEVPAPDGVPRVRDLDRHPRCGCGGLTTAPPDGTRLVRGVRRSGGGG
ncbi:ThiF family adenylyltransferase [Cellulosimicrobium marinum]|uniref:ThiF family adenylyltransferase n=1 Tax=Cellulosimicrobium marinum TaxID=1638992 RepID=UPI001E5A703B|nr:ThiF family adenylyltransferase [Cellulosimicrobium marinum]MCB7136619.1 ThiF family adenylyltransferase [Cellulosimicrobium marinum]